MLINMLSYPGPTSNADRQREFCRRNPGYYGRLHAKRRAESRCVHSGTGNGRATRAAYAARAGRDD